MAIEILRQESDIADRSFWKLRGPWDNEPDLLEWRDQNTGLACLMVRLYFHWCGYVGVPTSHPWFGKDYEQDIDVHGGLTFAGKCHDGEGEVWWFGFDCAHAGELNAATVYLDNKELIPSYIRERQIYRDVNYVQQEVTRLAEQLGKATH